LIHRNRHQNVMRHQLAAIANAPRAEVLPKHGPQALTWRHLATLMLLAATLPVFFAAGVVAMPVLLAVGCAEGLRRLWEVHLASQAGRR
jgi:hypothetical protein